MRRINVLGLDPFTAHSMHRPRPPRALGSRVHYGSKCPMPKRRQPQEPQEPIGIVISGGPHEEPTPRFTAYVYSIEDETSGEPIDVKAA